MRDAADYVGIDLAADAKRTGIARLRCEGERIVIADVHVGADDDAIVTAVENSRKSGVDVPFGWPRSFIELVERHRAGSFTNPPSTGLEWRRSVLYRTTDLEVKRRVGKMPLSVAGDKIAHPAIRWAGITARLRQQGFLFTPDGYGIACEVYPGATLSVWGLAGTPYKGRKNTTARSLLVDRLSTRLPRLTWGDHRDTCVDDDNALDAVIAALVACDVDHGRALPPPPGLADVVADEGWIWLPDAEEAQEPGH